MAPSPPPPLAPPSDLSGTVPPTVTAVETIDAAVAAILTAPVPDSPLDPSLQGHVNTSKQHARDWRNMYRPQVVSTLQGVVDWSGTFNALYAPLADAARRIGDGDASAIPQFKELLGDLQQQTRAEELTVARVGPSLDAYDSEISADGRNFAHDQQMLATIEETDDRQIAEFQQQIAHLQEELDEEERNARYAAMASNSSSAWAVVAQMQEDVAAKQHELDELQAELDESRAEFQAAAGLSLILDNYQNATLALKGGLLYLKNGWDMLDAALADLLESEDITTFNVFTQDELAAVKADWENVAQEAAKLGGVSPPMPEPLQRARVAYAAQGPLTRVYSGWRSPAARLAVAQGDVILVTVTFSANTGAPAESLSWKLDFQGSVGALGFVDARLDTQQHWGWYGQRMRSLFVASAPGWVSFGVITSLPSADEAAVASMVIAARVLPKTAG